MLKIERFKNEVSYRFCMQSETQSAVYGVMKSYFSSRFHAPPPRIRLCNAGHRHSREDTANLGDLTTKVNNLLLEQGPIKAGAAHLAMASVLNSMGYTRAQDSNYSFEKTK